MGVFVLALPEEALRFLGAVEGDLPAELLFGGAMATIDLPGAFGAPPGDMPVLDPEIVEMPREVGAKLGAWSVVMCWIATGRGL